MNDILNGSRLKYIKFQFMIKYLWMKELGSDLCGNKSSETVSKRDEKNSKGTEKEEAYGKTYI